MPTRQEIIAFIEASPTPVGKRDIVRAFKVGPADRVALKGVIKDIERGGTVVRQEHRRLAPRPTPDDVAPDDATAEIAASVAPIPVSDQPAGTPAALPPVAVLEATGLDREGEMLARLVGGTSPDPAPVIRLISGVAGTIALARGERAVSRLVPLEDGSYAATVIRQVSSSGERVLGIFHPSRDGGRIVPTDRRQKTDFRVKTEDTQGALEGELVLAELSSGGRLGLPRVTVMERLGSFDAPGAISLLAIHTQDIPTVFSAAAIAEAEAAQPVELGRRTDLRDIPLITIDGADARDFDDAVWAEADPTPENPGGWHLLVAIADVSWYVRPGSALDRDARERGNSVYFPDRVVPMLPEALSNELCSLKPAVERACMAIHLWFDAAGAKLRHKVVRGVMRSAARLTYERAQAAFDGQPDAEAAPLLDPVLRPLYGVYAALDQARRKRGALELDLPERRVIVDAAGQVAGIEPRARLDSHKLIEECMIAANVAAAETLEGLHRLCMYRVHDKPDPAKLEALRSFLDGLEIPDLKLTKGQGATPHQFNRLLLGAKDRPEASLINDLVLRSQAQALYAPDNIGHFGLGLRRYAHFTSPIRRYADLLVHRALVAGLDLGEGGLGPVEPEAFAETGLHLSRTERRAAAAERMAVDRFTVAFMADRVGAEFRGRVNGVTRAGLFVTLADTGADGLVPMGRLPGDYYIHEAEHHRLVGRRSGRVYRLGDTVDIRLAEADPVTGGLLFDLIDSGGDTTPAPSPGGRAGRGRTSSRPAIRRRPRK